MVNLGPNAHFQAFQAPIRVGDIGKIANRKFSGNSIEKKCYG